jgi:L-serine deaminase
MLILIARRRTVEAHARRNAAALHAAEAAIPEDASPRLKAAMRRLHETLAETAEAAGVDVAALSGGGPKPPRGGDD